LRQKSKRRRQSGQQLVLYLVFAILNKGDRDEMGTWARPGEQGTFKEVGVSINGIGKDKRRDDNRYKT
jgi:hypothetical protein